MLHYYAHLQAYAPGLREGQRVRAGQRLGTVGTTGNADAATPHLHFAVLRTSADAEWWEPGSALNPYRLLGGR
jgi:murein DD-endopeptidase MepM/ murein hydrolase activator NlpD